MSNEKDSSRRVLLIIGVAICVWGTLLAIGAYLELGSRTPDIDRDPRKFWIVLIATAGFLLFWGLALFSRSRGDRTRRDARARRRGESIQAGSHDESD